MCVAWQIIKSTVDHVQGYSYFTCLISVGCCSICKPEPCLLHAPHTAEDKCSLEAMHLYKLNQAGFDFFSWSQPKTIAVQITAGGAPTLGKERFSLLLHNL